MIPNLATMSSHDRCGSDHFLWKTVQTMQTILTGMTWFLARPVQTIFIKCNSPGYVSQIDHYIASLSSGISLWYNFILNIMNMNTPLACRNGLRWVREERELIWCRMACWVIHKPDKIPWQSLTARSLKRKVTIYVLSIDGLSYFPTSNYRLLRQNRNVQIVLLWTAKAIELNNG